MVGLIKDFALTALIIILNHWVYGVEDTISYEFIVNFISTNQTTFLAAGILGSAGLLLSASMFESLGLYKITYGLSKIMVRISQFIITFLTVINIVFYIAIKNNLMRDNGYLLLFASFLILFSSCWSLRIIDFNYNTKNAVMPIGILAFLSILLVEILWPLYFF